MSASRSTDDDGSNAPADSRADESATAIGINLGFDASLMLTPHYGAGIFVRYAGGSVDLPSVSDVTAQPDAKAATAAKQSQPCGRIDMMPPP